ncbi:MAG: type II toxin-antitoxin system PemK/MazF family toxin [Pleurocapsa sp. SU_196_0]|nr:type II toxin-antitoxin system PemK/MazF family toxin [Pleurocapsa sp. SU_196_0]
MTPRRGEVWQTSFDPVLESEGAGERPAIIVSIDDLNASKMPLVTTILVTSSPPRVEGRLNVRLEPAASNGLTVRSWAQPHIVRAMNRQRLIRKRGTLSPEEFARVEDALRDVLGL